MGIIANKLQQDSGTQPATTTPTGGVVSRALAQQTKPKEPNLIQGLAQDIARPFERIGGAVINVLDLGNNRARGGQQPTVRPGAFGGEVEQIGYKGGEKLTGTKLAKDVVGTGLEAGSMFIPGTAGLKGASTLAKVGKTAAVGGGTGAVYGLGRGLQEEETLGKAAASAVVPAVGGAVLAPTLLIPGAVKSKLMTPTEQMLESRLLEKFQKGIRPTLTQGKSSVAGLEKYNKNVVDAVKTIRENEPNLTFTNPEGEVVRGQSPKTIKELVEAGEQTKKSIFSQYDALAKQAGGDGLVVELSPVAKELNSVINNNALQITNPKAVDYAIQLRDRLAAKGKLDATTAQDVIQNYNKSLEAFYRNPTYDSVSNVAIDALVANQLRKLLDDGIEGITGSSYQQLKNQYGALKAIEKDVIKAFLRDERKNVKGLIDFSDIFSGGQLVNGILSMSPATIAQAGTMKAIQSFYKKLNDPNRAIQKVFEIAGKLPETAKKQVKPRLQLPPPTGNVRSQIGSGLPIPLGQKTQSKVDQEMVSNFGQRNQVSQTKNPTANSMPSTGEIARSIKNNSSETIPGTIPQKTKTTRKVTNEELLETLTEKQKSQFLAGTKEEQKKALDYLRLKFNLENNDASRKLPGILGLPLLGQKQQGLENEEMKFLEPNVVEGVYSIPSRKVTVVEPDLEELGAILFGEIGNRPLDKKLLEARTIANIALNRAEKEGKSLAEVLRQPNQFQAYKGNQYNLYKSGKAATSTISKEKVDAVNKILDEIRQGTLKNNIGDNLSYAHRKDNTIRVYKDWSEQKKDLNNIK